MSSAMTSIENRVYYFWVGAVLIVLIPFLVFVAAGWPGDNDSCVADGSKFTCYCESFKPADLGKPGVRQLSNTLFNLYALGTSIFVAWFVSRDRKNGNCDGINLMRSDTWVPELYVFVVLFLGLGSMWFHASLKQWGGWFDGLSMYMYASFLPWYTLRRRTLADYPWAFWLGYWGTVVVFTGLHVLLSLVAPNFSYGSMILIILLVVFYLTVEIITWVQLKSAMLGRWYTVTFWCAAVASIITATVFWLLSSKVGDPLCDPQTWAQPHALVWHPMAGAMAVFLYFYWRKENIERPS